VFAKYYKMLNKIYEKMYNIYGPQHWWPGETPFEVIIGAILTQNTNWSNVEQAIHNLKTEELLSPQCLKNISPSKLADLIHPSGFFNIKTKRLKAFTTFLYDNFDGHLDKMFSLDLKKLRHLLLEVKGIGPETADSILLYAGDYPSFVVDAYTKRIFSRIGILEEKHTYHQIQDFFMQSLDNDVKLFNEYHALIVKHAKMFCRTKPACQDCPLLNVPCSYGVENNSR
jgi:endonuclease-3 related protein